jgi:PAS domain S-box-containing protein
LKVKQNYSFLINTVNEVIFKLDEGGHWSFINKQWIKFTGTSIRSTLGTVFDAAFKDTYRKEIKTLVSKLSKGEIDQIIFDAELLSKDGKLKWVKVQVSSQFDSSNEILSFSGSILDISREKEVLVQLEESVSETKAVIRSVKDTLYIFSGDLKNILFISDNLEFLGIDKKKYLKNKEYWFQIIYPEDQEIVSNQVDKLYQDGTFDAVYRITNKEDRVLWIHDKAWAVKDQKNDIIKIYGRYTDISELKTKELKLKISEESLQKLNDLLQVVNETQLSFGMDKDFRIPLDTLLTKILEITESKFGFIGEVFYDDNDAPYLKAHSISNISWSEESEKFYYENYQAGLEFRNLNTLFGHSLSSGKLVITNDAGNDPRAGGTPKGHPPISKYMGVPVFKDDEFLGLMGFANKETDYSEEDIKILQPLISGYANLIKSMRTHGQKLEAEKLRFQSEKNYRLLSENTGDIIALHSLDSRFEYVSPSIYNVLGYRPEECIGKTPCELFGIDIDENPDTEGLIEFAKVSIHNHYHKVTGKAIALETIITPLRDNQETIYSYMSTSRDVTEREAVLEELKESLIREKELNQLKSRFISMTSHEFRTPLATIMSSTEILEILLENFGDENFKKKSSTHLARINNQIQRLTRVIADLLLLEKNSQGKILIIKEQVSINQFIKNTVDSFFSNNTRKIKLNMPKENRIVKLDSTILSHSLSNLIDNALKYSKNARDEPEISLIFLDNVFKIIVKDYGLGIPKEDQKYIFDSFFRARNVNGIKGTGLGLNIVREFIEKLGGEIHFISKENYGTEFIITLPYES